MQILISTALILLLCSSALGGQDLFLIYKYSTQLSGEEYVLYWTTNHQSKRIEFAVNVSTAGWVGFGLSPNGQMPGSDVVIGWVDNTGKVIFHVSLMFLFFFCIISFHLLQDRFATTRALPAVDSSQDWFITRGSEENGRTILEFHRNFTTCDEKNDMDIKVSHIFFYELDYM